MNAIAALAKLDRLGVAAFTTNDAAAVLGLNVPAAGMTLLRLEKAGYVARLARGRWALPEKIDKLTVPEQLTAPWPAYVSMQTALFHHGMISQIPAVVYAVTLARTKRYVNDLGTFSVHHINPEFFFGYESVGRHGVKMATPEKALLDVFYLAPARSRLFRALPELELPKNFSIKTAKQMLTRIESLSRRLHVERRLNELLTANS